MKHAFFLGFNRLEIWYSGVFGIADYESELNIYKFIMWDPIWWIKMRSYFIGLKFSTRRFLRSLIKNPSSKFGNSKWLLQYGRSKAKSYSIGMKFGNRRFLRSLITNSSSTFRNSKWWMQYGGPEYKKLLDWDKICFSEVFGVKHSTASYWSTNFLGIILVILDKLCKILIFWL